MNLVSLSLPALLSSACVECDSRAYRVIQSDYSSVQTLPWPNPPLSQQWSFRFSGPSGATPTPYSLYWGVSPHPALRWLYIGLGDSHVTGHEQPPVTETVSIQIPRDPSFYRVAIPVEGATARQSGYLLRLNAIYQPQDYDQILIQFLSLNNYPSPPVSQIFWANCLTIANYSPYQGCV